MHKIPSTFIAALLLLVSTSKVQASASFSDVPHNAWFSSYVQAAATAGIISGYADTQGNLTGKFGPSDQVTLAQALKMAILSAGYDPQQYGEHCLSGNAPWYMPYECVSQAEKIRPFIDALWGCLDCSPDAQDKERARFIWDSPATRAQVAYMVAHAFKVPEGASELPFTDVSAGIAESVEIASLSRDGILTGDMDASGKPTGHFRPNAPINRAEVTKIVMAARNKFGTPGKGRTSHNAQIDFSTMVENVGYSDGGFGSAEIHIKQGSTINICNRSSIILKVTSPEIPSMSAQPEVPAGSAWSCAAFQFKFMNSGTFHIQNQNDLSQKATVIVE